ncbi:DUF4901 domain-containing protein [Bacillus aquiflavi]|uniref:YcdB/YcdC domain-containing protein n=1 Tax=Bacillus aquiflavi TaxID=2672567 RepID=UPI001CA94AB2|nr:YcdB/YcdC domain-containing protein [Bacillus aquiflavi]UAC48780.1 DUF4901 domain-containing protein [Bacillus aquiflavi]
MLKEELKKLATSFVDIPDRFQPVIEEYIEGENGKGEAMFSWTNEEQDEGISLSLDLAGKLKLTRLSVEKKDQHAVMPPLSLKERRERAEQFLISHYPEALKDLTFYRTKKLVHGARFYYGQIVMGLPLDQSGCLIDVAPDGMIIEFHYKGVKKIPNTPTKLIEKEKLRKHLQKTMDFQLTITNVLTSLHDVKEEGLCLVYQPEPSFIKYKADVLEPTLTLIHEEDEPENYIALPVPASTTEIQELSLEEIIGITEKMEVIREIDMGEELGIVWRERNWKMEESDLSIENFFKRHSEDTVKAIISKKTGKLRSLMRLHDRNGNLQLDRDDCYQRAIDFLQKINPKYHQCLQLIVREQEANDNVMTIPFDFNIHNGHGTPIHLGIVSVVVNRKTGQIDYYSGVDFDIEQLSDVSVEPVLSSKEAKEIFFNHLDFKLEWNENYDSEQKGDRLVYQAYNRHTGTPIRYIDALTGAVISEKIDM